MGVQESFLLIHVETITCVKPSILECFLSRLLVLQVTQCDRGALQDELPDFIVVCLTAIFAENARFCGRAKNTSHAAHGVHAAPMHSWKGKQESCKGLRTCLAPRMNRQSAKHTHSDSPYPIKIQISMIH